MYDLPVDVKAAIKDSILGYLHNLDRADEVRHLKEPRRFQTHGSLIKGKFTRCLMGSVELPAGMLVYAFKHPRISYSAYQRIDDMDYPASGADIFTTGADWTLVCRVQLDDGTIVLADDYVATEPTEPRIIGKVA